MQDYYGHEVPPHLEELINTAALAETALRTAGWEGTNLVPYYEGGSGYFFVHEGSIVIYDKGSELPEPEDDFPDAPLRKATCPEARFTVYPPGDTRNEKPVDFAIEMNG